MAENEDIQRIAEALEDNFGSPEVSAPAAGPAVGPVGVDTDPVASDVPNFGGQDEPMALPEEPMPGAGIEGAEGIAKPITINSDVMIEILKLMKAHGCKDNLQLIAKDKVPERPGRREPRALKRRPKPFPLLNRPRHKMIELPHRGQYPKNRDLI